MSSEHLRPDGIRRAPIQVRPSRIAGLGVFAGRDILKGALIEECPVLIVTGSPESLNDYLFRWGESEGDLCALPLGYGALYNHSDEPNAVWQMEVGRSMMVVGALRDIAADEEIFVRYGPNWFRDREIVKR